MLNILEMLRDTDIVSMELTHDLLKGVISNDLECVSEIFNDTKRARSLCDS